MKVCYFGTYRAEYSRNQILIEGLRRNGVEVVECHAPLWRGIEDRVAAASGSWTSPRFLWRVFLAYTRLLWKYSKVKGYDVLAVGYPGQFDVYLARLLSWLGGKPLAWDVFMSIYLVALERGLERRSRSTINLLRLVERLACQLPDLLILDTSQYIEWFHSTYGVPKERFRLVPTGADDRIFHPTDSVEGEEDRFLVVYYGTFIPNHGVDIIVQAAYLLKDLPRLRFELIGDGPERNAVQDLADRLGLQNLEFKRWMEKEDLVRWIGRAQICLGAFGETPQSLMTIQNKIYEGLAAGKAVITGDSPAVRQAFIQGEHLYLCARGDPSSLADAILTLYSDHALRENIAHQGHLFFCENFTLEKLGARFKRHLSSLVEGG